MFKNISINRAQVVVLAIAAIAMSLSIWTFSRAAGTEISMCVKQSGASYVIGTGFAKQACNSNEQLLSFNITGPQGPQGIQGPIGPQGPEGGSVKVYDANDQVIGYVTNTQWMFNDINAGGYVSMLDKKLHVFEQISGYTLPNAIINPPGDSVAPNSSVYYESTNCTGQGYMTGLPAIAISKSLLLTGNGVSYYYVVDSTVTPPNLINYQSLGSNTPAGGSCQAGIGTIADPIPVKDVQTILDSYARPFHIGL